MGARVAGLTLAGLGAATLAVAVLVPVLGGAAGSPAQGGRLLLEEDYDAVGEGAGVTFLDPVTLEQRTGESVSVSVRVRGDADSGAADEDTAVRVQDITTSAADGTLISTTTTTVCLDRQTAEAVDCALASVDGEPTDIRGLTVAFPPEAPERDLVLWDGTAGASFPARFEGTERFRGVEVQRYEHVVPEQVLRSVTVPGALVGSAEERSPADVVYSTTRALLVEPVSGVVVSTEELPLTALRSSDGTPGAVLLGGVFRTSEQSVTDALARAQEVVERRDADGGTGPWAWVAGGAGLVLLAFGGLLVARSRALPAEQAEDGAVRQPVPVA